MSTFSTTAPSTIANTDYHTASLPYFKESTPDYASEAQKHLGIILGSVVVVIATVLMLYYLIPRLIRWISTKRAKYNIMDSVSSVSTFSSIKDNSTRPNHDSSLKINSTLQTHKINSTPSTLDKAKVAKVAFST